MSSLSEASSGELEDKLSNLMGKLELSVDEITLFYDIEEEIQRRKDNVPNT